jgi:hypothetical protein
MIHFKSIIEVKLDKGEQKSYQDGFTDNKGAVKLHDQQFI